MKISRLYLFIFLTSVACIFSLLIGNKSVFAEVTNRLPNAGSPTTNYDFAGTDTQTWLEVSKRGKTTAGVENLQQSTVAWYKVYSTTNTITIKITDAEYCSTLDVGNAFNTSFVAYKTTADEKLANPITKLTGLDYTYIAGASLCNNVRTFTISGLTLSNVYGHTSYYTGLIKVKHLGPDPSCTGSSYLTCGGGSGDTQLAGRINRYKLLSDVPNQGLIDYWIQNNIQNVSAPINDSFSNTDPRTVGAQGFDTGEALSLRIPTLDVQRYDIEFATPCTQNVQKTAYLKWFDADQGQTNQTAPTASSAPLTTEIRFDLIEDPGLPTAFTIVNNYLATTGDNAFETYAFTLKPGKKYQWKWKVVDRDNGVQFWMPFDGLNFNAGNGCPPANVDPIGPDQSLGAGGNVSCTNLKGWTYDSNNSATQLKIAIYLNAPAGSGQIPIYTGNASQANPVAPPDASGAPIGTPANHGYNIDVSNHVINGANVFYVYSYGIDGNSNQDQSLILTYTSASTNCTLSGARPTGTLLLSCLTTQAGASNAGLRVRVNSLADADLPGHTRFRIEHWIDSLPPFLPGGVTPTRTVEVNGTTNTDEYFTPSGGINVHTIRVIITTLDTSSGAVIAPTSTVIQGQIGPCAVTCTATGTGSVEPADPQNIIINIVNNGSDPITAPLTQVDIKSPNNPAFGPVYTSIPSFPVSASSPGLPFLQVSKIGDETTEVPSGSTEQPSTTINPGHAGLFNTKYANGGDGFATRDMPSGTYDIFATFNGVTYSCGSFSIGYKPYWRAYNGDVYAGTNDGSATTNCPGWGTDVLYAYSQSYAGAKRWNYINDVSDEVDTGGGNNHAVIGSGGIEEVHTATLLDPVTTSRDALLIANTGFSYPTSSVDPSVKTSSAGGYSQLLHCPNDFYGKMPAIGSTVDTTIDKTSGGAPATNNWLDNMYDSASNSINSFFYQADNLATSGTVEALTIPAQLITDGPSGVGGLCDASNYYKRKTISLYVDGDVIITGNITYEDPASRPCKQVVPKLQLVVRGRVFVANTVNRLDGVFVVQPKSGFTNSGKFYTCRQANGNWITPGTEPVDVNGINLYNSCANQLVINGSLSAYSIKLHRTFGSRRDATRGNLDYPGVVLMPPDTDVAGGEHVGASRVDPFLSLVRGCERDLSSTTNVPAVNNVCASEVFIHSPEVWLTTIPNQNYFNGLTFDYISSLAPLL